MKIDLKEFQAEALNSLYKSVCLARNEIQAGGQPQAVVLSSPTGSGKTAIITALMERIISGDEAQAGDPDACFLWLTDQPDLNEQSKQKILATSNLFTLFDLETIDSNFDQKRLSPRRVYFLNIQKLGKGKNLVTEGDKRTHTIWDTITNTLADGPQHFFLVLDEAHKGMAEGKDRERANSIVQRFVKGQEGEIPPVPLIIGMSATPDRFHEVLANTSRVPRSTPVNPEDVTASGLLKARIVLFHPEERQPTDWSLLAEAARRWKVYSDQWAKYCTAHGVPPVRPVLVVQVENASKPNEETETNLREVISVIEREIGPLADVDIAHAFETDAPIQAGKHYIRKIPASMIESASNVKVVFFKLSLTTGWDCPRAEVMMSFRRAHDFTHIAQLVGRMVRAPLARQIHENDFLNSVSLYLPHYSKSGLQKVLERLQDPDPGDFTPVEVTDGRALQTLVRAKDGEPAFALLERLPSYVVERIPKATNVKRLVRLGRQLTFKGIDPEALDGTRSLIVEALEAERRRLEGSPAFKEIVSATAEVRVRATVVDYALRKATEGETVTIPLTPENVENLFGWCSRKLGEGLHLAYWKRRREEKDPIASKIELFAILQDDEAEKALEEKAYARLQELLTEHKAAIKALPEGDREPFRKIRRLANKPEVEENTYPAAIDVATDEPTYVKHLYVSQEGTCHIKLNTWEQIVIGEEIARPDLVSWLRNPARKPWSFCIPYEAEGEYQPLYPDFLVIRKVKGNLVADVLEPHGDYLADAWKKAVGMAQFAKQHGESFDRIEYIIVKGKKSLRLNMNDEAVRDQVLVVKNNEHLRKLLEGS